MPALAFVHVELKIKPKALQLLENPKVVKEHMLKKRLQLRMTQAEVAQIIGVSEDCITYWENSRSVPQIRYYPKIIQFFGVQPI